MIKKLLNELTDKKYRPTYKRIMYLAGPAFVELFLSQLFNMVDMAMVGNLNSSSSGDISSVGITNQPFFLLVSFFAAINVGTTTLVAWKVGSGNSKDASTVLRQSLLINVSLGLILGAAGIWVSRAVMSFMSQDPYVVEQATVYFQIVCASLPFMALNMAITSALRGAGQTKIPMFYNLIANGTNVFMNWVLIFGHLGLPRMGVAGAALATTLSRVISGVIALLYVVLSNKTDLKLRLRASWKPRLDYIKKLFSIGIPSSAEQLALQSGLLLFQRIVSGLGTDTYDAHQVAISINGLAFSASQAFSVTTTTLVGQAVGAGDYALAELNTRFTSRVARATTFLIAMFIIIAARPLCRIYTGVDVVIELARPVFFIVGALQFIQSSQMSHAGALRGAGDTMYPFYSSMFGIWLFRVPLALLLTNVLKEYGYGLVGAWISFLIDQCVRNVIIKRRFKRGKWKMVKAKKEMKMAESM